MNDNNIIKIRVEQKSGIKIEQTFGLAEKFNIRTKDIVALDMTDGTKKITSNGIHDVKEFEFADVFVDNPLQTKEFEYTENDTYSIEPDEGYFLERVDVKVNVKGIDTSDATAVAEDILKGKTAYANDQKIIGSIETYDYSNSEGSLPQSDEEEENVKIVIPTKNGLALYTKGKFVEDDIQLVLDESLIPSGEIDIDSNGEYDVTNYEKANINVPIPEGYLKPEGTIEIIENGSYDVTKYANAEVNTPQLNLGSGHVELNSNGTHNINANEEGLDGYNTVEVLVNVQPDLQEKTVTENGVVLPDKGYDGLSKVVVEVSSGGEGIDVGGIIDRSITTLSIPNGTTKIGANVFNGCTQLQSIEIPSSVTTIEDYAFYNCKSLKSIEIPYGVTSIGQSAFMSCENAASISIADSVTTIKLNAFCGCASLNSIVFPNLITKLASSILSGCKKLTSIIIPNEVTEIESSAFSSCSMLASINLPSNLKTIGDRAFNQCESLTSIEIPYGVTIIPTQLFQQCTKLTSVTFPNSITTIEDYVFSSCSLLTNLTIPSSVTSIENGALQIGSSSKKATIRFEGMTPPTLSSSNVFRTSYLSRIEVPSPAVNTYKSATNWSSVSSYIKGYDGLFDIDDVTIVLDESPSTSFTVSFGGTNPTFEAVSNNVEVCTAVINSKGEITVTGYTKGIANITVNMVLNGVTHSKTFEVKVFDTMPYKVENVDGATYGFKLNANDYYESTNQKQGNTASLCKLTITSNGTKTLYLDCINSGESNYDYGILSKVDKTLSTTNSEDSSDNVFKSFRGESSTSVKTINYGLIEAGKHFIYIKYRKDSGGDNGNDSLQFKVRLE